MISVTPPTDSTSLIGDAEALMAMARKDGTVTVLRRNFH